MTNDEVYRKLEQDSYMIGKPVIEITDEDIADLSSFLEDITEAKAKEGVHKVDPGKRTMRFTTGNYCERAVEKYLHIEIIDRRVGKSSKFKGSDLKKYGLKCGVKGAMYGNVPMPLINAKDSEIIVILVPRVKFTLRAAENVRFKAFICGVATPDVILKYSLNELVKDPRARKRKNGFYGFDKLINFKNLTELGGLVDRTE